MQPFTVAERLVVIAIMEALLFAALAGAGVEFTWWGGVALGALAALAVSSYCSLYNLVCK